MEAGSRQSAVGGGVHVGWSEKGISVGAAKMPKGVASAEVFAAIIGTFQALPMCQDFNQHARPKNARHLPCG